MKKFKKVLLTISLIGALGCSSAILGSCKDESVGVSFNTNGATSIDEVKVQRGEEVSLPTPTREGYRFDGWYTTSDFSGNPVTSVIVTENVTYFAKWTQVYAVNLDLNGGSLGTATIFLAQGENIYNAVKNLKPTKAGLTFGAWFNGNNELSSSATMKTGAITLKAQYKVGYTVEIWAQNLDDDGYTKVDTITGSEYVGKNFTSTQKLTGFSEVTEDSSSLTKALSENAAENVFVHKFDRNTYTITFNPNVPGEDNNEMVSISAKYGETIAVPSDPTQYQAKGYCLLGWATGIDAKKVQYPVDLNALAYNKDDAVATEAEYLVEKTTTLYGVWQKGYTDMFGSDDTIYYMESEEDSQIYLCRGNVYFKGIYDADYNEFIFNNEKNKIVVSGKLYDNGKFVYYDDSRAKVNSTLYTTEDGVVETEKIRFNAYNEIRYIVYDKDENGQVGQEKDTSIGTYEVAANGDYVATFTSGNLAGQTMSFIMSSVTLENGKEQSVFQVRNPDEYQIGRIILLGIRRNDTGVYVVGFYDKMYFELDGFGTAKFTNNGSTSTYNYSTDKNGNILLKDGRGNVVETICLVDAPDGVSGTKGYMVYDKTMDDTFELNGGATLTLDGLYTAVYEKDGKSFQSYYRHWTNPMGGTTVSIIDPETKVEYRFMLNPTTKEVEGETVDTYTAKSVLGSYSEYYYQDNDGVYYAPMLVIDETAVGKASLYGYTSEQKFVKVSEGSYTLIEEGTYKGLYMYEVDEIFHSDDVYIEPIDVTKVQWFIFALDEETSDYKVNYWYVSNLEDYFDDYQSTDITSNESLKLVGGFAFYKADATSRAVIGTYSKSGNILQLTVDGESYYFNVDWENNKFTTLQYEPYKAYLKNSDGTYSNSVYLDFDGIGGAVYAVDGKLIEGSVSRVESNGLGKQTIFGEEVYKFQPSDTANANYAFEYIDVSIRSKAYFAVMEEELSEYTYYTAGTSQTLGSLTIDGYAYWAEFNDYTTTYAGVYYFADENTIVLEASGNKFYFDFLTDGTFVVRGREYGTYALYENQYTNGVFVELDGYGKLTAFTFEKVLVEGKEDYKRQDVSTNGTYEIENGVYTFTYGTGTAAKAYVCILNGDTYNAVDGASYTALTVSKELAKQIYVDKTDWSVLILDEFGRAVKCDKEGKKQEGKFAFITDELLYFFTDGNKGACIYSYEEGDAADEYGIATPIKMNAKSYYTEELKSLYFSESGFAIVNGDESNLHFYTYVEDNDEDPNNDKVVIYRRATAGEAANEFGFVCDADMFDAALGETTTYNDETYYINSGDLITFERSDAVNNYPLLGENVVYELTSLRFAPSGSAEFEVSGQAQIKKTVTDKDGNETVTNEWETCTITRRVVDGVPEMYVTVSSYYRYYITATYTATNKSYKVDSLQREQTLDSYYYLNEYFYTYLYNGLSAADQLKNKYGSIEVFMQYAQDGEVEQSSAKLSFGEGTEFFDMDGNRISSDNATFTMLDNGMNIAQFVAEDGYTYQVHFGVYRYPYMTLYGYYVHALVRLQELQVDDYTLTVGRVVATEQPEDEQPLGEVYTLEIKKNGEAMENAEFFYSNDKIHYVVRETNDDGYATKATYYAVSLTENDSSSVEDKVPTYASATVVAHEAAILCEEGTAARYVEMVDGEIQFINLFTNKRYAKDSKYNQETGVYTVNTTDGWTYYVKVVGEYVVISSNLSDM